MNFRNVFTPPYKRRTYRIAAIILALTLTIMAAASFCISQSDENIKESQAADLVHATTAQEQSSYPINSLTKTYTTQWNPPWPGSSHVNIRPSIDVKITYTPGASKMLVQYHHNRTVVAMPSYPASGDFYDGFGLCLPPQPSNMTTGGFTPDSGQADTKTLANADFKRWAGNRLIYYAGQLNNTSLKYFTGGLLNDNAWHSYTYDISSYKPGEYPTLLCFAVRGYQSLSFVVNSHILTTSSLGLAMQIPIEVTTTASTGVSMSSIGTNYYDYGTNSNTYTWNPDEGYTITSITIDGQQVNTNISSYTFSNMTSNHSIHIQAEKNPTITIHDPISNTVTSQATIPYESTYTLPATEPTRYGYTFREYSTTPDGTGQSVTEDIASITQDTDLYIIWDAIPATALKTIIKDKNADGNIIPNKYTLSMSTEGRTYTQDKHLIFVVDRTGSLTQPVYDELANTLANLSKQLTQNENVKISCVLFSRTNTNPQSDYYSGYYIPFTNSTNVEDFKKLIGVPVSTTATGIINGVDYSGEQEGGGGTSWHSGFIGLEQILRDTQESNTSPVDIMFFSDGYPNAHVNDNGQCIWGTQGNEFALSYEKATAQLKQVLASYSKRISSFSSIGLEAPGGDLTIMKTFTDECLNGYDDISKTSINAPTAASVSQNLRDIAEKNTIEGHLQNIRIEDMLSENVDPASTDEQGRPAAFIYKKQENTGNKTELIEKEDYSYIYNTTTKKITLQYNHPLPQGESIHMDIPIIPTDSAYQKQVENAPQNIGEKGTGGDSEGIPGYKSNEGTDDIAYASTPHGYQANARLPIPVIQPETGTITFDRNTPSAEGEDITITDGIGQSAKIPENPYSLYGHVFMGWAETPDGAPVIQPGYEYTIMDKNKTLYAIWETVWIEMPATGENPMPTILLLLLGTFTMLISLTRIYRSKEKKQCTSHNQYRSRSNHQ